MPYNNFAWRISAFMAATAAGTFWGNKSSGVNFIKLAKLHTGVGAYFALWLLLIWFAAQFRWVPSPGLWTIFGAGIGVLIGLEFSCANILFFARQKQTDKFRLGTIYAADLFGSCLGALGVSVFMVPAYGVYKTLLFLIIVNALMAVMLL